MGPCAGTAGSLTGAMLARSGAAPCVPCGPAAGVVLVVSVWRACRPSFLLSLAPQHVRPQYRRTRKHATIVKRHPARVTALQRAELVVDPRGQLTQTHGTLRGSGCYASTRSHHRARAGPALPVPVFGVVRVASRETRPRKMLRVSNYCSTTGYFVLARTRHERILPRGTPRCSRGRHRGLTVEPRRDD